MLSPFSLMDASTYLAQVFGLLYTIIGIGIFVNTVQFRQMLTEVQNASAMTFYCMGAVSLTLGFTIITFHTIWSNDWRVVITLIGWAALLKGAIAIVQPKILVQKAVFWQDKLMLAGAAILLLGLFLGYHGFAN